MPPVQNDNGSSIQSTSGARKYLVPGAIAVLVVMVGLASVFLWNFFNSRSGTVQESIDDGSQLVAVELPTKVSAEGKILLTLLPKGRDQWPGIYAFDVATRTLEPLFSSQGTVGLTASFLANNDLLLATDHTVATSERGNARYDIVRVPEKTRAPVRMTSNTLPFKRHPLWSEPLKAIVYSAKPNSTTTLGQSSTNDFKIFLNKEGRDVEVGEGAMPQLLPGAKSVLVMRRDGLHTLSLETKEATLVWPLSAGASWFNMQFDVSADGKFIAWSNPYEGKILIMQVTSWAPFKGSVVRQISAHAFWPVFSSDGRFLAFEEVKWGDTPTKPRLVLYSLEGDTRESVYDLDAFVQEAMFVTDWR